jgi:hypothetical protein
MRFPKSRVTYNLVIRTVLSIELGRGLPKPQRDLTSTRDPKRKEE